MLVTLLIANKLKIGNHNKDPEVTYISTLSLKSMSLKSGLADDTISITIPRVVLKDLNPLVYLTNGYSVTVSIFTGDNFEVVLDGIIFSINNSIEQEVTLNIKAKAGFYMEQLFLPRIENVCQLQVYSDLCGLDEASNSIFCPNITIDALTGLIPYTLSNTELVLNSVTIDIASKPKFKKLENYNLAFIDFGNSFRSKILKVTDTHLAIELNYLDDLLTTDFNIILSCDKTYGGCYTKFKNTKKFYGFSNLGKQVKNYNIFTSEALVYCGEPEAPQKECDTDNYIFGVKI